jgi:hypothetical protein
MAQPQAKRAKRKDCATTSSPTQHGKKVQLPPFVLQYAKEMSTIIYFACG